MLGHPDNYIKANALVTPAHIVPEWYFLPFYAILRSIPDKLGGVACMGLALVIFFVVPFIHAPKIKGPQFKPIFSFFFLNIRNQCYFIRLVRWSSGRATLYNNRSNFYFFLFFLFNSNFACNQYFRNSFGKSIKR
jgi:ubiquinol-cytochrome c reductase cytochrome b subunit